MLVIANGAFKSGSTWQRNLIKDIMDFEPELPKELRFEPIPTFIDANRLSEIIASPKIKEKNFISKAHVYEPHKVELLTKNKDDVKVFMMSRDIRDVIVSYHNHFINRKRSLKLSFRTFYWLIGRFKAMQIIKYNRNWAPYTTNVLHSTFEGLKKDTAGEIKKYADFLGVEVSDEKIEKIIEANSLKKRRENSHRPWFFRKGEVGDYKNFMTKAMERDLKRLERKINVVDSIGYYFLFGLRKRA